MKSPGGGNKNSDTAKRGYKRGHLRKGYIPGDFKHNKMVAIFGSLFSSADLRTVLICAVVKNLGSQNTSLLLSEISSKLGGTENLSAYLGELTFAAIKSGDTGFFERIIGVMKHPRIDLLFSLETKGPSSRAELAETIKQTSHPIAVAILRFCEINSGRELFHYDVREYVRKLIGDFDYKTFTKTYKLLGVNVTLGAVGVTVAKSG